jgi:hypothetical protein
MNHADSKPNNIDLKTVAEALNEIETSNSIPIKASEFGSAVTNNIDRAFTKHTDKCPECDGRVEYEDRSNKASMTVYGRSGVRHVLHTGYRCVEKHCRTGLYHGYRILKGGMKVYEDDCLDPSNVFLGMKVRIDQSAYFMISFIVVSRKTAFDIDFLYSMTLKQYRHNATLEGLSDEFNDFFCEGLRQTCMYL